MGVIPATIALLGLSAVPAGATIPSTAPQVLLAITNSESMDGNTSGAIMLGSGSSTMATNFPQLLNSSSPAQYTVPTGFVPPVSNTTPTAAYTATCGSNLCDNSASRLNMTKAAIKSVLASYGATVSFGIFDYSTSGTGLYTTWVYEMSATGGFTYTNTASTATPSTTVLNPCYGYQSFASGTVKTACTSIASQFGNGSAMNANTYMVVSASSDNPQVNDVLYSTSGDPVYVDYGTISPANPFSGPGSYSLSTYNANPGNVLETYGSVVPSSSSNGRQTSPTNAGYVPYAPQTMYIKRGFGYNSSGMSATTGNTVVPIGTDYTTTSGATLFNTALAPETNSTSSSEIKASATQSAIAGLMKGAKTYLAGVTHATCQSQYVVLMTDGLPTLDLAGKAWPPLGTLSATAYSLTASYDSTGAFMSSNSQAVTDAIAQITALNTAGIKVYVIGLGAGVNRTTNPSAYALLQAMAIAGGTSTFFPANDPTSLNNAFQTIVAQIYAASSVAAPLVPRTVQSGSAFEYMATSSTPAAGHVAAFPVDSSGNPTSFTASWTTDTTMTTTDRTTKLYGGDALLQLSNLADADFALPSQSQRTACVPNRATIVSYTVNPYPSGLACSATTYLGSRDQRYLLGAFSQQDSELYLAPPANVNLAQNSSYLAWARSKSARPNAVLLTSQDGFLYSLNSTTGALNWGWMSKYNLTQLQNYTTFQSTAPTNGDFSIVDASDGTNWGTYLVGSFNSGGSRFSLKLDDNGAPSSVAYDTIVGGTSTPTATTAGDVVVATGNGPLRQPPVIWYSGNRAYTIYAATSAGVSTLYETNVATGATTSATLPFVVSSALYLDTDSGQLWMGGTNGSIYVTIVSSNAATDVARIATAGSTYNPAAGSTSTNVQWVYYFVSNGSPYFLATNSSQITLFGANSTGWVPLWTMSSTYNYTYTPATPGHAATWNVVTTSANTLQTNAVISDMPLVIGGFVLIPAYVPGTGCALGTGYYDFAALSNGTFPTTALTLAGLTITGDVTVGQGSAFTPSVTVTSSGYDLNGSSSNNTNMSGVTVLPGQNRLTSGSVSWRLHF